MTDVKEAAYSGYRKHDLTVEINESVILYPTI